MRVITVRDLNKIGRVGNQLFLYCFAKGYALAHGCELQVGPWFGRDIFVNATEPFPIKNFPQTELDSKHPNRLGDFFGKNNLDLFVYGQHQKYIDFYTRAQVRQWLTLKPEYERFAPKERPECVAHIRHGDYVTKFSKYYCAVTNESYKRAVDDCCLPDPVYVFDGWRKPTVDLTEALTWLDDFLFMRDAKILLRANSSFSWWAATLGHGEIYAPVVDSKVGWNDVEFIDSNHPTTAGYFKNQSDLWLQEA